MKIVCRPDIKICANPKSGKVTLARKLYADKFNAIADICKTLHISRVTLYRYVK